MDRQIPQTVGLWLAEGDNVTNSEITFTNNCWELVEFFHNVLVKNLDLPLSKVRIYVYNNINEIIEVPISSVQVKNYVDTRATKPYYIWRFASVSVVSKWKEIVKDVISSPKSHSFLMAGFFAGEGNIKFSKNHNSRVLRIAQAKPNSLIENILHNLGISFRFRQGDRQYWISGKWNWDIFANLKLADLHPQKREGFWKHYSSYKQNHYPKSFLKNNILDILSNGYRLTSDLAKEFERSKARITEVVVQLKKEGLIWDFRVRSKNYWTGSRNIVIISKVKKRYLKKLKTKSMKTSELAKEFRVDWHSASRRLNELKKLELVDQNIDKAWIICNTDKEIIIK